MGKPQPKPGQVEDRIRQLLSGKVDAPNDFVKYLVQKANEVELELNQLAQLIMQGEKRIKELRTQFTQAQGKISKYVSDIQEWDDVESQKKADVTPLEVVSRETSEAEPEAVQ